MYGDWEGEIAISQMAYPLPDEGLAPLGMASVAIHLGQESWEEDWAARPADDEFALALSGDPFVNPATEDPTSLKAKPGSDEDWLTPLSNDAFDLGTVDVTGTRYTARGGGGSSWDPAHDTGNSFYDPWGAPDFVPIPDELPACVSTAPANVDEDALMKIIQYLTDELRGVYNNVPGNTQIDSSRFEYGVAIYEINGQIGYGDITTNNSPDYVNILTRGVPDGARIIGYMHNHPDQPGIDDRVPSSGYGRDWDRYDNLVSSGAALSRGITVDANLLLVLYTNQDDKMRIYDKNDKNTSSASCAI